MPVESGLKSKESYESIVELVKVQNELLEDLRNDLSDEQKVTFETILLLSRTIHAIS